MRENQRLYMDYIIREAKEQDYKGIIQLEFNVWDFNQNAIDFFSTLGYSSSGHVMWKVI